ncbi:MAG: benzoate/H(+) symporter BenE family transporter [Rhizobiales bacterium]|nr:benzoate/H(+) symporter BenE family transporter [Hyphomicrobiales bacterium]NRB13953.1 benzoate/H(+) symporter BenE family transporter [Hyphomicrobiales bacterium]
MFGLKLSHITAGFIAVLVGYSSSVAVIFQAAEAVGATQQQINSWMLALGLGMGISGFILSYKYKIPILTAWSTPGAALLVVSLVGVPLPQAIGAFLFCGLLLTLTGISGWFEKLNILVPKAVASAMLAGILFQFGIGVFVQLEQEILLVSIMGITYLLGKIYLTRYAVPLVLLVGILASGWLGLYGQQPVNFGLAMPVFIMPEFNLAVMISVGVPLYIVTMTSQNMPGVATLRAANYEPPISAGVTVTGITTILLAPFGGFTFNFAAITAAICLGEDVDANKNTRYKAALVAAVFYGIIGLMGAAVVSLFLIAPKALVVAVAGMALFGTIGNSLHNAMHDVNGREAALVTFLVTVSGLSIGGIGAAFWGVIIGVSVHYITAKLKTLPFDNQR